MTLDYLFLGFGVHVVGRDDDGLLCRGFQKDRAERNGKTELGRGSSGVES